MSGDHSAEPVPGPGHAAEGPGPGHAAEGPGNAAEAAARRRLAEAQSRLLHALVAGAAPPPGFDPALLRVQIDALIAKRRDVVARLRPDLAADASFAIRFHAYARASPRPVTGARADADAFARTIGIAEPTGIPGRP